MDKKQRVGKLVEGSGADTVPYQAYIPNPLPPDPPLDMADLAPLLEQAHIAIGRLDSMSETLPDTSLFINTYIRKEALLSSQIEGTQSSLSDLFLLEAKKTPRSFTSEAMEVVRYVSAMEYGLKRINEIPISLRLIKEVHKKLMTDTRGKNKQPGEFRRSQNWIGGAKPSTAVFVPPPADYINEQLSDLEKFLNEKNTGIPVLIKAALAHVQFETIHPFLDGNGRLGRLLITFILCVEDVLKQPLLYLSLYLKIHRNDYYNHLQSVRETGDWEAWIKFFLKGVIETAEQATKTMQAIRKLFAEDNDKISEHGKSAASVFKIHNHLQEYPMTTTRRIKEDTGLSRVTVLRGLKILEDLGIAREITGEPRHKLFVYDQYFSLLKEGTDPLPR